MSRLSKVTWICIEWSLVVKSYALYGSYNITSYVMAIADYVASEKHN